MITGKLGSLRFIPVIYIKVYSMKELKDGLKK